VVVPFVRLDVRPAASAFLGRRTGGIEECLERLDLAPPSAWGEGRGGARMAALCAVVDRMMSAAALTS
jgi:hypothetical protein